MAIIKCALACLLLNTYEGLFILCVLSLPFFCVFSLPFLFFSHVFTHIFFTQNASENARKMSENYPTRFCLTFWNV